MNSFEAVFALEEVNLLSHARLPREIFQIDRKNLLERSDGLHDPDLEAF